MLILAIVSSAYAQVLSLQECVDKTLKAHPNIKSFVLDISLGEQNYLSAQSAYLPQLNFQAQYDLDRTYTVTQNTKFTTMNEPAYQAGLVLGQKIWDFSKTSSKIDAAYLDKEIAQLSLEDAKALMIYKVELLYATMIVEQKAILVRQKDMQTKQELYHQAQALVKEGIKISSEETRFLSSYYEAQDALGIASASFEKTKSTLWLYMGEKMSATFELEEHLLQEKKNIQTYTQEVSNHMLSDNVQLKIQEQNIQKNRFQQQSAKASHYGSLDAVASYTHFDNTNAYDASAVSLTLNVPIYSGGNISATEQIATIATNKAKEQKNAKLLELQEELNSLLIDLERYENTIIAKQAQLEAAKSTEEVLGARYKEGLVTYIELLDASTLHLASELGLLEAYFSRTMTQNRIKYLTGKQI